MTPPILRNTAGSCGFGLTSLWDRRIVRRVRRCRQGAESLPTPNLINAPCRDGASNRLAGILPDFGPFPFPTQPRRQYQGRRELCQRKVVSGMQKSPQTWTVA